MSTDFIQNNPKFCICLKTDLNFGIDLDPNSRSVLSGSRFPGLFWNQIETDLDFRDCFGTELLKLSGIVLEGKRHFKAECH